MTAPYPIFLHLHRQHVLIVGGGAVAFRKIKNLQDAGARITIISPAFHENFAGLKNITRHAAPYATARLAEKPYRLVFATTDNPRVNTQIAKDARKANILCCRADDPAKADFVNAATATVGPVTLAISTGGAAPTLAARIRQQALDAIDPTLTELAALHHAWRSDIKKHLPTIAARRELLHRLASDEMESLLRTKGKKAAEKRFAQWLAASPSQDKKATHAR